MLSSLALQIKAKKGDIKMRKIEPDNKVEIEQLISSPIRDVRIEVVEQGYALETLLKDDNMAVRAMAKETKKNLIGT